MKSRISFFEPTVLRKDITRFFPVWGLYLIGGLLVGVNTLASMGSAYAPRNLMETLNALSVMNLIYAAVCTQMLFGDLFNSKLCNALHALPLRRESWFVTHSVAGLLFSLVPNLVLSLCFMPMMGGYWYLSFAWLLGMELEYLFFFGLAALCCILTGNRIGMALVYGVVNFISVICYWFVDTFYAPMLVGVDIPSEGFMRFCPVVWCIDQLGELAEFVWRGGGYYSDSAVKYVFQGLTDGWWYLAILAGLGILALVLGVLLYRRRKLESAGDLLAFKPLEPVFAVIATLCTGAVFQIMGEMFLGHGAGYIYLIVGIPVGYFAGRMLLERRVKVFHKRAFLGCGAIVAAMGLSLLLTWLDPLGVTRWTPKPENVESVTVVADHDYNEKYYNDRAIFLDDPDLIASVIQAHECLIEEGVGEWQRETDPIILVYKMDSGREVRRHYYYPVDGKAAEAFNELFSDPKYILGYEDWDSYLHRIEVVLVNFETELTSDEQIRGLLEAMRADCEAGTMTQTRSEVNYVLDIRIVLPEGTRYLNVFSDCTNTLTWIKKNLPSVVF